VGVALNYALYLAVGSYDVR